MREIPSGLRITFLINFIQALVFGLAGTFAARLVGDIAGHPVHDFDVNYGLGATTLGLAVASWYAFARRAGSLSVSSRSREQLSESPVASAVCSFTLRRHSLASNRCRSSHLSSRY